MTQDRINIISTSNIYDQMVEIPSGKIELKDDRTKQKWTVDIEPFFPPPLLVFSP